MSKKVIVAVLVIIGLLLGVIGLNLKRANDLREYALANNCVWSWNGTAYGDDRDYVCK